MVRALLAQSGSLVKEKIFSLSKRDSESSTPQTQAQVTEEKPVDKYFFSIHFNFTFNFIIFKKNKIK